MDAHQTRLLTGHSRNPQPMRLTFAVAFPYRHYIVSASPAVIEAAPEYLRSLEISRSFTWKTNPSSRPESTAFMFWNGTERNRSK